MAVTLGALMLAPSFTPAAAADSYGYGGDWVFGAGFRVGGFHFSIGYAAPRYGHAPVYYYRSSPRLSYRGHRCHDRCFRHQSYAYHHRDCPLVGHHFGRHRVEPRYVLSRFAPHYGHYYDRDPRYDRDHRGRRDHDRYDRRDRHDRHDRYDRRHRHDRWDDDDRRGRHRDRDHDHRDRHRGRRGHDHRDHRGGSCPFDR